MNKIRLRSIKVLLLSVLGAHGFAPIRNSPLLASPTLPSARQQNVVCKPTIRQKSTELYFLGTDGGILGVGAPEVVRIMYACMLVDESTILSNDELSFFPL